MHNAAVKAEMNEKLQSKDVRTSAEHQSNSRFSWRSFPFLFPISKEPGIVSWIESQQVSER